MMKNWSKKIVSILLFMPFLLDGCQAQEEKQASIGGTKIVDQASISYTGIVDFRHAAKISTPCVVHIKSTYMPEKHIPERRDDEFYNLPDPFEEFFKNDPFFRRHFEFRYPEGQYYQRSPIQSGGSGVILTSDGYIVTNNHVIRNADEIEVILSDRRSYMASVIGTDEQTDLALIKIDEKALSFILYGNSDSVEIGEWVVAVGNPFNMASTVTAGIVSAKARNINILKDQAAIESFIQTDAAVNPGNSGGALVTLDGKLIGINTAIATPTGTYAGYAFAIPSKMVQKVVDDFMEYGVVQRGFLGIVIQDLDDKLAKELNLARSTGVYVNSVMEGSAADEAGIKDKDVIIRIDDQETESSPNLQEIIARHRPGEKVKVSLIRNTKEKEIYVTLKNKEGTTKIIEKDRSSLLSELGIDLVPLKKGEKQEYGNSGGVKVAKIYAGKITRQTSIREGFLITKVNNKQIESVDDFITLIETSSGGIMLEGKYPNDPTIYYYAFGL